MKKLIGLLVLAALTAGAQNYNSQSFLAPSVRSIEIGSNALAATSIGVTNLECASLFLGGMTLAKCTNIVGTTWTNIFGVSNTVHNIAWGAGTNGLQYTNVNLLSSVALWPNKDGGPFQPAKLIDSSTTVNVWSTTNFVVPTETFYSSPAVLTVKARTHGTIGGAKLTMVFQPITDDADDQSVTTRDWVVDIPVGSSTNATFSTNAPMYKWGGYQKLRLRSISNPGLDENDLITLLSVKFHGFVP